MPERTTRETRERAVLVAIEVAGHDGGVPLEESVEELRQLAYSAGAEVLDTLSQRLRKVDPARLLGAGKVEEIRVQVEKNHADLVICDMDLSPGQQRNLESSLNVRVIDRSQLILDIFAQRAQSKEGKLQVELAQLEYLLPRLTRRWLHLSRLAGGIGTRGPGETQLEVDRRRIRERIGTLKERLAGVKRTRRLQRRARLEFPYPTVALVGYTNSGKSTLMNRLTRAGVLAEDKLFATLDPRTRGLCLPNGQRIMLVDTVGFINKIPHSLIEAFKSTLEEVKEADLLLCMMDVTSPLHERQMQVVEDVLRDIGAADIPKLIVPNKIDLPGAVPVPHDRHKGEVYPISARTGAGTDGLLEAMAKTLDQGKQRIELCLAPSQGAVLSFLRSRGQILEESYDAEEIHITALVSHKVAGQLKKLTLH